MQFNTSNTTIPVQPIQPINLYKKQKRFSIVGDWLNGRKELKAKGFKEYYAFIERKAGNKGFCYLKNETIAEVLGSCVRTIQHYHSLSQKYNLIQIVPAPHGRGSLFVPCHHPWMGIDDDQAAKMRPELPASIIAILNKHCGSGVQTLQENPSQTTENKEDLALLEIPSINHVEELRGMHATEVASIEHITNSNIAKEKETANINANIITTVSVDDEQNNQPTITAANTTSTTDSITTTANSTLIEVTEPTEPKEIKSIYTLEIILRFVLAYAMMKLGSNDPIRDHRAIATTFLQTGEKDAWIDEFIKNGYVLSPINPLKDHQVEQAQGQQSQQAKARKISPKQARKAKRQANENTEIKGKYDYQVYLEFADYEFKQNKGIDSVDNLAKWLQRTGAQDNTQVKQYFDLMNSTYAGGKAPNRTNNFTDNVGDNHNNITTSGSDNSITTTNNQKSSSSSPNTSSLSTKSSSSSIPSTSPSPSKASSPALASDLEAVQRATAIESLAATAWHALISTEKEELVQQTASNLLEKQPEIYAQMAKEGLEGEARRVAKGKLGEALYRANLSEKANCDEVLECLRAMGKDLFEGLEDYEQAELTEARIEKIDYYYSASASMQGALLEEISSEIYLELSIAEMAKG